MWIGKTSLFMALLALWVVLTGKKEIEPIFLGSVLSALAVRFVWVGKSPVSVVRFGGGPRLVPLICFIPIFLWDLVKSTWDVAMLALRPKLSLSPAVIRVGSGLKDKSALVFLANQITLTPGTLTLDADMSSHSLFVHVLNRGDIDASQARTGIYRQETRIARMMGTGR